MITVFDRISFNLNPNRKQFGIDDFYSTESDVGEDYQVLFYYSVLNAFVFQLKLFFEN